MDTDGLISAGTDHTQLTWMDAKIGNFAVTPRNGKAVEVNALWYNAIKILENLARMYKDEKTEKSCTELSEKVKQSFNKKFYNKKNKCLYDVLENDEIRPNQLFALSVTYPVLDMSSKMPKEIFETVTKELVTKYGLATLSSKDKSYVATYEGDSFRRDMSYHQGITWPWLAGLYMDAFKNVIKYEKDEKSKKELSDQYKKQLEKYKKNFTSSMKEGALGSISELYDSKPPYNPGGTTAQGWSVSEVLKIMLEK